MGRFLDSVNGPRPLATANQDEEQEIENGTGAERWAKE
jgi:hypothetical protein